MRFEIGKGGVAAISLGLILLSTSVFVFGLCVGWDIGSQSQRAAAQMATAYPLEAPPAAAQPAPVAAARPESPASEVAPPPAPPSESANAIPPAPAAAGGRAANGETRGAIASSAGTGSSSVPAAAAPLPPNGASAETASPPPPQTATAERPGLARGHRKPFNIQIEAAMDSAGATQMMKRLQQLGYSSHLVPTDISGQTWYKVEVGPYGTQEEAAAAEVQLRAKYNAMYGGGSHPDQPAESNSE